MEGYYLIPWELLEEDYDFGWLYANMGTDDVIEGDAGYYVRNFPDTNPPDNTPDFLQTGAGTGTTVSQGEIHG